MNLKSVEILFVFVAFLIGWFLRTMITSVKNNNVQKVIGEIHYPSTLPTIQSGVCEGCEPCNNGNIDSKACEASNCKECYYNRLAYYNQGEDYFRKLGWKNKRVIT